MKLNLSVVTSTGANWADVEENGTLLEQLSKGDELDFSPKNIENTEKLLTLFIYEKGEEAPKMLPLSKRLSKAVRQALKDGVAKVAILRALLEFRIITNDKGTFLIPNGKPAERISFDALKTKKLVPFEELAGL